jgi:hypothetical protein
LKEANQPSSSPTHAGKSKRYNLSKEVQVHNKNIFFNLPNIVVWNNFYRIRHIGTGKYLALANDKLELTFKSIPDFVDTLFRIKKESLINKGAEDDIDDFE